MSLDRATTELAILLKNSNVDKGHGIDHALKVLEHATHALKHEKLFTFQQEEVQLAALLHDADDSKFFNTNNYQNAQDILINAGYRCDVVERVIDMIKLVSCSKNLNNDHPRGSRHHWKLIPRLGDRLEAMGKIGIYRCYEYTIHQNRPLIVNSTPLPKTRKEVIALINDEQFQNYQKIRESKSMIDHFYDKILHLRLMVEQTSNLYIKQQVEIRHDELLEFLVDFANGKFSKKMMNEYSRC